MNILRVTRAFPPKVCGWSGHAQGLSAQQAALGHSVRVMQPIADSSSAGNLTIRHIVRPQGRGGVAGHSADLVFNMRSMAATVRQVSEWRPDIVHVHGDVVDAAVQMRLARRLGVPIVLTLHSSLNRRRRYRMLARPILSRLSGVIGVSASARDDAISLGVPRDRTAVISSGVEPKFAEIDPTARPRVRAALGIPENVMVTVFVGRLETVKGIETLSSAATRLDPRVHRIVVVGDGTERDRLTRERSGPALLHVGERSKAEVLDVLRAADAFVLPSVDLPGHREGTPTALLEALVVGLPVLVTDSGGMPDLVDDPANGSIVPQRDPVRLAEAIAMLADRADARRAIALRNRDLGRAFLWPSVATRVLAFYVRLGVSSPAARACDRPEALAAGSEA
jgi:glycosyltransferase involved in cell wall biosynthesis